MLQRHPAIVVVVIGLLPFVLAACSDAASSLSDPRTQPPLVRTEAVERSVQSERAFTGIVAARVQSDLGFRVPGKVLERLVNTGQTVKRGQTLMRIDPTDLTLAVRAHDEAVVAARARARQTADDELRYRDLVAGGAVSASAYDKVKADAEAARAQLNVAEAQAGVARNETGYAVLLADADGVVVETLAEPGQVVSAGQVVVRLAHAGRREAVIELPETLRPAIGSTGRATLYGSGQTGSAKLRQVSDGRSAHALRVPMGAIFDPGKGPGVWLVQGETLRVTWRAVQIAGLSGEAASVVGNLEAGDRVVALGAHLLHEGEHVRLAQSEAARSVAVNGARLR